MRGEDPSGWAFKARMWGFPHGCELNEGGVGWGYPEWVEADDVGVDERFSEVDEAKGWQQTTSTNMKTKPLNVRY
ncbi:MAG: hypothetical protein QXN19_02950 [Sulfolobales archaeon]